MKKICWLLVVAGFSLANWISALGSGAVGPWALRNPLPVADPLLSVTFGAKVFVAVGVVGSIYTSTDGLAFTRQECPTVAHLNSVTYGKDAFVAVGNFGTVLVSEDGSHWILRSSGSHDEFASVTYGNGLFVAVGSPSTIWTSPDGWAWTKISGGGDLDFKSVAYGNGRFVAASANFNGRSTVVSSADGTHWTEPMIIDLPWSYGVTGVAFGNGTFVVVSGGARLLSADGLAWSAPDINWPGAEFLSFAKDGFVAAADGVMLNSSDGVNWTRGADIGAREGVAYGNETFLAVGWGGVLRSTDGAIWTGQPREEGVTFKAVAYGTGGFVAGDAWRGGTWTSPDGVSWGPHTNDPPLWIWTLAFGNGLFVATDYSTFSIHTSSNGLAWTTGKIPLTNPLGVGFGNGLFVVTGSTAAAADDVQPQIFPHPDFYSAIWTSSDGVAWTMRAHDRSFPILSRVVYGNGVYVANAFSTNQVVVSNDGVAWTMVSLPDGLGLVDYSEIAFGNGTFVLMGHSLTVGFVYTSTDGRHWTQRLLEPSPFRPASMTYGNGLFAAFGSYAPVSVVMCSPDGVNWTTNTINTVWNPGGIAFGNGTFVATGEHGIIFQSSPVSAPYQLTASALPDRAAVPGTDNGSIHIRRSGTSAMDIALNVSFSLSGSAQNGVDYLALTNSVTLPAGEAEVTIPVVGTGSLQSAWIKTAVLTLEPGEAYTIGTPAAATVFIENPGPAPRFRRSGTGRSADGTMHLLIDSPVGASFNVEYSDNLADWLPLSSVVDSSGAAQTDDHAPPTQSQRFYRATTTAR